ncbi:hypothetical protein ACFVVU_23565 [Kitasatospora sp. NPDC057965]|uniref:hypothetical protein n=1 Tax=Kitasatospora sp. NPDC057965 TaxID=3346291 RepID=UPI0036D7B7BB
MTRLTADPRVGPHTSDDGQLSIWVRRIGTSYFTFWAWPDQLAVYRIPEGDSPQLIHTYRKETP